MQVYKFGGASIASPERLRNVVQIIQSAPKPLTVIVSAMGKVTNALEEVVRLAIAGEREAAEVHITKIETQHYEYIGELFSAPEASRVVGLLSPYFTEMRWALDDAGIQPDDYLYDQIVCIGELLSTRILAAFMMAQGIQNIWKDARDIIRTNEYYRNAVVDVAFTQKAVQQHIFPHMQAGGLCITQGFIGASSDNNSTTLGREGSDYSAALIASMLDAESVSIWKDVPGFLNADPRKFPNAVMLSEISYHEVIELAYYGAQIIHPKTIKPLQNAGIPLYVRCFLDSSQPGTAIKQRVSAGTRYPPLIVHKSHQLLMKVTSRDFSFITEENLANLYQIYARHRVKINMIQNAAISFVACIDSEHFAKEALIEDLNQEYEVRINDDCTLLTVRHYEEERLAEDLVQNKKVLLRQRSRRVFQILYKEY